MTLYYHILVIMAQLVSFLRYNGQKSGTFPIPTICGAHTECDPITILPQFLLQEN